MDPKEDELGLIHEARSIDDLMELSGLNYEDLISRLNQKVIKGHAQRHPGGRFSLKPQI